MNPEIRNPKAELLAEAPALVRHMMSLGLISVAPPVTEAEVGEAQKLKARTATRESMRRIRARNHEQGLNSHGRPYRNARPFGRVYEGQRNIGHLTLLTDYTRRDDGLFERLVEFPGPGKERVIERIVRAPGGALMWIEDRWHRRKKA